MLTIQGLDIGGGGRLVCWEGCCRGGFNEFPLSMTLLSVGPPTRFMIPWEIRCSKVGCPIEMRIAYLFCS